jgi:hypothetical protein
MPPAVGAAIIMPQPPAPLLERFFAKFAHRPYLSRPPHHHHRQDFGGGGQKERNRPMAAIPGASFRLDYTGRAEPPSGEPGSGERRPIRDTTPKLRKRTAIHECNPACGGEGQGIGR